MLALVLLDRLLVAQLVFFRDLRPPRFQHRVRPRLRLQALRRQVPQAQQHRHLQGQFHRPLACLPKEGPQGVFPY